MPALDPISRDVYADILSAFPALEQARDADQVVQAVQDAAPDWLPGKTALEVELSKLYVKPQKHVRILYHFIATTRGESTHVWAVGRVAHRDVLEKARRKAAKAGSADGKRKHKDKGAKTKGRAAQRTLSLWDQGLELEPFTDDAELSHVARLTDTPWAMKYFQNLMGRLPLPADAQLRDVTIDPFKYLPGKRIVLRYHLHTGDDTLTLFAKHYDGDRGRAASEVQNQVSRALEKSPGTAAVPRVYHYDADLQVSFQQAWEGHPIEKGDSERPRALWQRLLHATRALHAVSLPRGTHGKLDARALLYKARKDVVDIAALLPQMEGLLQQAEAELVRTFERETPHRIGFLHGSLLPSQILLGEKNVGFIDFDGTAEGDPLYDVCELLTSFLFEDWRLGRTTAEIHKRWTEALEDVEAIYEQPVSHALAGAYTSTFLMNRTHQHLKKLRPFPEAGLPGLTELLRAFPG